MPRSPVTHAQVKRSGSKELQDDLLVTEEPLEIRIVSGSGDMRSERSLTVTMRTPGHDFELAQGFLFSEGILSSTDDIEYIRYCETVKDPAEAENVVRVSLRPSVQIDWNRMSRNFYTSSACGVCGKTSIEAVLVKTGKASPVSGTVRVHAETLLALGARIQDVQTLFRHTGGIHAAALFSPEGEMHLLREDVGRHNAVDKLLGAVMNENKMALLPRSVLYLSGRGGFELIQKAVAAGIPVIASVGAPTSLAVQLAEESGVTLIGFLRNEKFNVYASADRVYFPQG